VKQERNPFRHDRALCLTIHYCFPPHVLLTLLSFPCFISLLYIDSLIYHTNHLPVDSCRFHFICHNTDKPEIEIDDKIIHSGRLVDAELTCNVYADPPPNVTWSRERDSRQINVSTSKFIMSNKKGTEYTLKITNVVPDDFDNYTCHAVNMYGITDGTVELVGFARTAVIRTNPEVYSPNASYKVEWEVASNSPIMEYRLRFRKVQASSNGQDCFLPLFSYSIPFPHLSFHLSHPTMESMRSIPSLTDRHKQVSINYRCLPSSNNRTHRDKRIVVKAVQGVVSAD
jgi:hypothetical protein